MELDSGAGVSVISQRCFKENFMKSELRPTKTRLRGYSGEVLDVTCCISQYQQITMQCDGSALALCVYLRNAAPVGVNFISALVYADICALCTLLKA